MSIINVTADSEVDESIQPVNGISAEGPAAVRPSYVYTYDVHFSPSDATDKGVYWYVEDSNVAEVLSASGTTCYVRGVNAGTLELVAENVPVTEGYASFPLGHCSDYILTAEMLRSLIPNAKPDDGSEDETKPDDSSEDKTKPDDSHDVNSNDDNTTDPAKKDTQPASSVETSVSPKTGEDVLPWECTLGLIFFAGAIIFGKKLSVINKEG